MKSNTIKNKENTKQFSNSYLYRTVNPHNPVSGRIKVRHLLGNIGFGLRADFLSLTVMSAG